MIMERKIGEIFECEGVNLRVDNGTCSLCYFCNPVSGDCECSDINLTGECLPINRSDGNLVCFVNTLERKVGEEFDVKLRLKVVQNENNVFSCSKCAFFNYPFCDRIQGTGTCTNCSRLDGKNVHFEIIQN